MLILRSSSVRASAVAIALAASTVSPRAPGVSAGFVADAAQLRAVLEEGDPSLYRHRPKSAVDSAFGALADSAAVATTETEFWTHVTRTLAFLRDGHLTVLPSGTMWGNVFGQPIPFTLRVANERLYVLRNLAEPGIPPAGSEILAVNGMTANAFLSFCLAHISADGTLKTRGYRKIERDFDLACGTVLGSPARYAITFRVPGEDRVRTDTVSALNRRTKLAPTAPAAPQPAKGTLWVVPGEHIAVLTLHTFSKSSAFNPSQFMQRAFRTIADSGVTTLVIDLRENGGGRDGIGAELFAHVARDTFTYARRTVLRRHFSFGDWVLNWRIKLFISTRHLSDGRLALDEALDKTQRPVAHAFQGRVITLADRSTFSTASEVVALMQAYQRATIVGEETATGRDGDSGATTGVVLKNSFFILDVPLVKYELPAGGDAHTARGVLPDIPVEPSIQELIAGRDVVMDAALLAARRPRG